MEDMKKGVCFLGFIIFLHFYVVFTQNKIIEVDFYPILLLCLIAYLAIFKYLYLIKNTFVLRNYERKLWRHFEVGFCKFKSVPMNGYITK